LATTAITAELLVLNTRSADLPDAGGGSGNGIVATTPSDGWVISPASNEVLGDRLVLRLTANGSGDTVTFAAGNRYPAQRPDLGTLAIVLAASDTRFVSIETSRFLKNDGTIVATATDAGTALTALHLPKAP
jgi:hypothetical protein